MLEQLSGETRVFFIIGHPIAQVKAPAGLTQGFAERGRNAAVIPIHVLPEDVDGFLAACGPLRNVDGIIATIPHKFAMRRICAKVSPRAELLTSTNLARRLPDGSWEGDMLDGFGFVRGMIQAGCQPEGKRALLIGAGGAGSAIGLELLDQGVAHLAVHDADSGRREELIARLKTRHDGKVSAGSPDPSGFDIVVNATPTGMGADDPLPVLGDKLTGGMFVGDVITAPEVTPLLTLARSLGCKTQTGIGMFLAQRAAILDFLEGKPV